MSEGGRADFGRVQGVLPAYTADGEDPVKIGGHAWAGLPTPCSDSQVINTWHDLYGRIIVAFENQLVTGANKGPVTASVTGTGDSAVLASPALGSSYRISSIFASNIDPSVSSFLNLKQGSTIRVGSKLHLDGGGWVWNFEPGGWILDSAQALLGALSVASTPGVQVNVMYRLGPTPT